MLFRLLILVIQLKKTDYDTKIGEIDKRKSLIMIIVATILLQRNLKSQQQIILLQDSNKQIYQAKMNITRFLKKKYLDEKLKNLHKKVISNKTKHVEV